jgi:Class II Aldolase and Adducin N-terminal domain
MTDADLRRDIRPVFLHDGFLHAGVPVYPSARLVADDARAAALSACLGSSVAVAMRSHGVVAVGESDQQAFFRCTYLEEKRENARQQVQAAALGGAVPLVADEARACAEATLNERMFGLGARCEQPDYGFDYVALDPHGDIGLITTSIASLVILPPAVAADGLLEAFDAGLLGEIGGDDEERAADLIGQGYPKPVVALVVGERARRGRAMGHAGAIVSGDSGSYASKVAALQAAGVRVAGSPIELARQCAVLVEQVA